MPYMNMHFRALNLLIERNSSVILLWWKTCTSTHTFLENQMLRFCHLISWESFELTYRFIILQSLYSSFFFIPCHSISFSIFSQQWQTFLSLALDIYPSLYLVFFMSFTWYFFFLIVAFIYRIIIHNNFSWSDAKCDSARFHKSKMKKKWDEEKKH